MKPTPAEVHERLNYDPDTGLLTWRESTHWRCQNGQAGTINGQGYRQLRIKGRMYLAHRLVWLMHYGEWPVAYLDHINGDRLDNRLSNLREATRALHSQNRVARGTKANGNGWTAAIRVNQKRIYLGTEAEAHAAYVEAKRKHHIGFVKARYV